MGNLQNKPIDNLTQEEIKELEDTFNLFDDDGSGTISAEELGQVCNILNLNFYLQMTLMIQVY